MKILVTGGTGRIGSNLVKKLLEKGHEIRSFVYPGMSIVSENGTVRNALKPSLAICANMRMLKKPLKAWMLSIILPLPLVVPSITVST